MADALTATELVLAREQHLSQLDGLAAAAAHELGTPLSTISVVAKELQRALGPDSPYADDVKLLREQAERCRDILGKLSALPAEGAPFERAQVFRADRGGGGAASPFRHRDRRGAAGESATASRWCSARPRSSTGSAIWSRTRSISPRERVEIAVRWSEQDVAVTISDDGPGFPPEILRRIGEPYVTSRAPRPAGEGEESGLGLGFFIAKTLLERSGATVAFLNRAGPGAGAVVRVRWPRSDIEAPATLEPAGPLEPRNVSA